MIPRISKGSSAYGALAYDHGPGRRDEHENAHKVAGNVPGRTWKDRARVMDEHAKTARGEVAKPLHRTSLRISESDRKLTDREWKQVANEYVERMGFDKCPWEATRHADDHIHITVSRVQWDGKLAKTSHDYAKAQAASRQIERTHGLEDASRKYNRERPEVSKGERESAERRSVRPEREQLRDKLTAAERASDGTRASYEQKLTEQGVHYRANVSKTTGRVSGYSYGLEGHTTAATGEANAAREQVWFKGSQLGGQFSWNKTQTRLAEQQKTQQDVDRGKGEGRPPAREARQMQQPMTREQAREEAARRAAERQQQRQTPSTGMETSEDRKAQPMTQENTEQRGPMTREQAREEAARRAAEREQQRSTEKDQERGR
ncbi:MULTISPECIES: relaxase/mobilization nuclease domain-containing protein [unclassified Rhodococcus (in: high G+C Gram-positive bacteria)]|uniref:relaxase/mobilization nuclease domain-containing protein n=1 Tax=unclassified Rhodococcus (in: high G+C Gram-positive bacteria) TaxID=192944 RepID=UPI00132042F5|nr:MULTISPECIES: hypothetical protein [unclassified Rhodococcus (in: high G+C Gram-positive bacteria)]QHE74531.1 mobilization protein [Rhodococcus sp. WAY2]